MSHIIHTLSNKYKGKFIIMLFIFLLAILIGYIYQSFDSSPTNFERSNLDWHDYYLNNIKVASVIFLAGLVSYGILSGIIIFFNGLITGIAMAMIVNTKPILFWQTLFPHAIFELPALLLASITPFIMWNALLGLRRGRDSLKSVIKLELIPIFITVIFTLLVASVIEANFSSYFVN